MDIERQFHDNILYFDNKLLPYTFVLHTAAGVIIVKVEENNFKHLLGGQYSNSQIIINMPASRFYSQIHSVNGEKAKICVFDIIDKDRYIREKLIQKEVYVLNKIEYFQKAFDTFLSNTNFYLFYRNDSQFRNDTLNADYVHFQLIDNGGLYLGIIGGDADDFFYFNSILYKTENPDAFKGPKIKITKVEIIESRTFDIKKYKKIIKSKQNTTALNSNKKATNKIAFDFRKNKNEINKHLHSCLRVVLGRFGKKSVQLYKGTTCIENHFELLIQAESIEQVIDFINNNY